MNLQNKSIIICSIVRNAGNGLRKNIPVIRELCRYFYDYKVVIFENDSKDSTKQLLNEWVEIDSKRVFAFMTDIDGRSTIPTFKESKGNPFFGHKRIDRMAALRNQYMDLLWEMAGERPLGYDIFTYITQINMLFRPNVPVVSEINNYKGQIIRYFEKFGIRDWRRYLEAFAMSRAFYPQKNGDKVLEKKMNDLLGRDEQ